jgi:hypothetical protein
LPADIDDVFMMRRYVIGLLALTLTLVSGYLFLTAGENGEQMADEMLDRYCLECHNGIDRAGELALDSIDLTAPFLAADRWEAVIRKLRTGMMPPAGEARPERASLDAVASYLEVHLDEAAKQTPNPGAPALHRLNRTEYGNAIRDLLALDVDVETLLPADDAADGFDNIAGVLTVSPALIEGYVAAGMKISRRAVGDMTMLPKIVVYRVSGGFDQDKHFEGLPLGTRGGLVVTHDFPLDAEYEITVGRSGGGGFPGLGGATGSAAIMLNFDGKPVDARNPRRFRMRLPAGPVEIAAAIVDRSRGVGVTDYHSSPGRTAGISQIQIEGPFAATGPGDTPSRRRIFSCYPTEPAEEAGCAREILSGLASSAYRKPLGTTDPEIDFLFGFFEQGQRDAGFEDGIQRALAMMLINPRFLFRLEAEPDGLAPGEAYRVSDLDLASRLSFFLWSSIPDDELLSLADDGRLGNPDVLRAQVARMLADPKSAALVDNFAGQWLYLRALADVAPEAAQWDENLRHAMREETELLFRSIVDENRSIVDLIDADFTFVNERLARHYGIEGIKGSYFRRVEWPADSPRRGILGHGSLLTVTSVANRTSPVVRGAWILENLIGAPPPAPPAGVESNLDDVAAAAVSTLRERLERHRENPTCASCHSIMDPIGLALERFDLIGGWRSEETGRPIDPTGVLVDGTAIAGPTDLRQAILDRAESFVTVATEKLSIYALGRGIEYYDMPAIRAIVRSAEQDDFRFSSLVYGIVTSAPFQMRVKSPIETEGSSL